MGPGPLHWISRDHLATITTPVRNPPAPGAFHQRRRLPLDPCHWAKRCSVHLREKKRWEFWDVPKKNRPCHSGTSFVGLTIGKKIKRVSTTSRFHHLPKIQRWKVYVFKNHFAGVWSCFFVVARVNVGSTWKGQLARLQGSTPPKQNLSSKVETLWISHYLEKIFCLWGWPFHGNHVGSWKPPKTNPSKQRHHPVDPPQRGGLPPAPKSPMAKGCSKLGLWGELWGKTRRLWG